MSLTQILFNPCYNLNYLGSSWWASFLSLQGPVSWVWRVWRVWDRQTIQPVIQPVILASESLQPSPPAGLSTAPPWWSLKHLPPVLRLQPSTPGPGILQLGTWQTQQDLKGSNRPWVNWEDGAECNEMQRAIVHLRSTAYARSQEPTLRSLRISLLQQQPKTPTGLTWSHWSHVETHPAHPPLAASVPWRPLNCARRVKCTTCRGSSASSSAQAPASARPSSACDGWGLRILWDFMGISLLGWFAIRYCNFWVDARYVVTSNGVYKPTMQSWWLKDEWLVVWSHLNNMTVIRCH